MTATRAGEPWAVFFEIWNEETRHLPRVSPIPDRLAEQSPAFQAIARARERVWTYMMDGRCSEREAARTGSLFMVETIVWSRLDGFDRGRLKLRLERAEAKVRAACTLGIEEWEEFTAMGPGVGADGVVPVQLPPELYLVRERKGEQLRVPPWDDALHYVTDGVRYGVQFGGGRVKWFEDGWGQLAAGLQEDFEGVDLPGMIAGLKEYAIRNEHVSVGLANEIAALEALMTMQQSR